MLYKSLCVSILRKRGDRDSKATMASFINNPLTSLCNTKSEANNLFKISPLRAQSLGFSKFNGSRKVAFPSVVCKAVSVPTKSSTEIEGLNIAEDVTQVILSLNIYLGRFYFVERFETPFVNLVVGSFYLCVFDDLILFVDM